MHSTAMNINTARRSAAAAALLLFSGAALASGSSTSIITLFNTILSALNTVAPIVVTIAVIWCGYRVLFGGRTIQEVAPILLGAVLIGGALWITEKVFSFSVSNVSITTLS